MTLDEFLEECQGLEFEVNSGGRIRQVKTRCCPVVAVYYKRAGIKYFPNGFVRSALNEPELALPRDIALDLIWAADHNEEELDENGRENLIPLRRRLEALCR